MLLHRRPTEPFPRVFPATTPTRSAMQQSLRRSTASEQMLQETGRTTLLEAQAEPPSCERGDPGEGMEELLSPRAQGKRLAFAREQHWGQAGWCPAGGQEEVVAGQGWAGHPSSQPSCCSLPGEQPHHRQQPLPSASQPAGCGQHPFWSPASKAGTSFSPWPCCAGYVERERAWPGVPRLRRGCGFHPHAHCLGTGTVGTSSPNGPCGHPAGHASHGGPQARPPSRGSSGPPGGHGAPSTLGRRRTSAMLAPRGGGRWPHN